MAGATAGLAAGAGLGVTGASIAGGAAGGAAGKVAADAVAGKAPTLGGVMSAAGLGAVAGALGVPAGKAFAGALSSLSNASKGRLGEALTRANEAFKGYASRGVATVDIPGMQIPTGRTSQARFDFQMQNVFTGTQKTVEAKWGSSKMTPNQKAAAALPGVEVEVSRHTAQSTAGTASGATTGGGASTAQRSEAESD